ncbi:hypothetical protein Desaci_4732 (plasmid) [Desulfosporosinus acidiphilus SJ4]|uniref:Class III signal peptide-containing protein n=1 Tax=Desulfosporosinus acidiphilus (strain DSM 22704 / JCM 16185 / SJ4) TaxID=646529 RepID=I4DCN5_DESAJ|nr:hypothetical protein [Desulfosporosinus acidiphilus]AFM43559.1 hypothetical protein Desaci_4732 [Desulfosporosinus acidiphilus SJ4]
MRNILINIKAFLGKFKNNDKGYLTVEAAIIIGGIVIITGLAVYAYSTHVGTVSSDSGTAIDSNYNTTMTKVGGITIN